MGPRQFPVTTGTAFTTRTTPVETHDAAPIETLFATLTGASARAMIGGIGPLKAAWRRSGLAAVSKP
jgi:hypothetical protein